MVANGTLFTWSLIIHLNSWASLHRRPFRLYSFLHSEVVKVSIFQNCSRFFFLRWVDWLAQNPYFSVYWFIIKSCPLFMNVKNLMHFLMLTYENTLDIMAKTIEAMGLNTTLIPIQPRHCPPHLIALFWYPSPGGWWGDDSLILCNWELLPCKTRPAITVRKQEAKKIMNLMICLFFFCNIGQSIRGKPKKRWWWWGVVGSQQENK